jgi:hypothetical protein
MGRSVVALLGFFIAGCVSANVHRLDLDARPPRPPESIEVLEEAPTAPYTVIARVECRTGAVYQDADDLRCRLVEEAAQLGADALILGVESKDFQPIFLATGVMIMSEEKMLQAEVIVFDRPEETVPGVAPAGGL